MPDYLERRGHRISLDLGEVAKRGYKKEFLESILNQNEGKWLNEKQEVIGKLERSVVYVKEESKIKEVPKGYVLMHLNHDSHTFLNLIFEEIRRKITGSYLMTRELSPEDMRRLKLIGQVLV